MGWDEGSTAIIPHGADARASNGKNRVRYAAVVFTFCCISRTTILVDAIDMVG